MESRWFEAADVEVSVCRRFVRSCLEQWGLDPSDAVLLSSELATNAVVHARSRFLVALERRQGRVRVEVSDDDTRPIAVPEVAEGSFSGRGLAMVVALADAWGVDQRARQGKTVWFELETRSGARQEAGRQR